MSMKQLREFAETERQKIIDSPRAKVPREQWTDEDLLFFGQLKAWWSILDYISQLQEMERLTMYRVTIGDAVMLVNAKNETELMQTVATDRLGYENVLKMQSDLARLGRSVKIEVLESHDAEIERLRRLDKNVQNRIRLCEKYGLPSTWRAEFEALYK